MIRLGFVSNSSSSSFICCYAKIENEELAMQFLNTSTNKDWEIKTTKECIEMKNNKWGSEFACDWAGVWCEPKIEENKDEKFMIYQSWGGAGDSDYDFCESDDCYDLDYDVDYDDFESDVPFINKITKENGFIDVIVGYGAGRNG